MNQDRSLVLTIDDDSEIRALIRHCLRRLDIDIIEAKDGESAIAAIATRRPDLILLDVCMPGRDGLEVCRELRAKPECRDIPIVIVSSLGENETISHAYDVGATDFLVKPFDAATIAHRVRYLLRAGKAFGELRRSQGRLEHAQRIAKFGYWEWNIADNSIRCSDEAYRIFGAPLGMELTAEAVLRAVHRDDLPFVNSCIAETMRTGEPYSIEHRIFRGVGGDRIVDHHGQAIFDGKQQAQRIIGTVRDITEQRQAESKIHRLAYFDALTGLPNRLMLREHLEETLPQTRLAGQTVVLMSIDLDRFKRVNDSFGHQVGDELLLEVRHRLRVSTRSEGQTKHRTLRRDRDLVARVGEDGFSVMMLVDDGNPSSLGHAAERILEVLRRPIELNGHAVYCTASVGIAIGGRDGSGADALIKNADAAMFHAKSVGRNGYQFYAASISEAATDSLTLESEMRQALENNMFYLAYQPKFDVATNRMMGMEALIRCRCSMHGAVGADRIIAIAEETGLIHSLRDFVLRSALAQLKQWEQQGYGELKVSVNLSPLQFRNLGLIKSVEAALADSGVAPEQLELEITESSVMYDIEHSIQTMHALKRLGIALSIDDFGVGYSSLGYLARLPVDCLKIDRSFVTDLPSNKHEAIVARGIISMARGLSLTTVAEGVETGAQFDFLKANGCEQIQGYLLSRPISPEEVTERFLRVPTKALFAFA